MNLLTLLKHLIHFIFIIHSRAKLYLENKLIAVKDADTRDDSTSYVWNAA